MFKTVLVAIDPSEQRERVLAQAAEVATCFGAVLHLVSVRDLAQHWELTAADPTPEIFVALEQEAENLMEDARRYLEKQGISPRTHLLDGDAIEQIALLAERLNADLIVIGHRHLSRIRRLVENSVAKGLVARAPCSVMITIDAKRRPDNR